MKSAAIIGLSVLVAGVAPSHAQWAKTNGPDSVRAMTTGTLVYFGDVINTGTIAGRTGDVLRIYSAPTSQNWAGIKSNLSNTNITALAIARFAMFAGTAGGGVFRRVDDAGNQGAWSAMNTGLSTLNVTVLATSGLVNNANLLAGTDAGVFYSTDNGDSWTAINTGLTNPTIAALAVSGVFFYAGTSGGVFVSVNGGANWSVAGANLTNVAITALAVSGANLYAGTSGGIFMSTNSGSSWEAVNTGLTNTNILAFAVSGANVFAGTSGGVFLSTNSGTSWTSVSSGLTSTPVRALTVTSPDLFAGTEDGTWRRPLSEMVTSVSRPSSRQPTDFRLHGDRSVSFTLPVQSAVTLKITDLSGRLVSTPLAEELPAGRHTRALNTRELPKGLYFLRFQSGAYTETKKILLSR
jgi:hypothetical protein